VSSSCFPFQKTIVSHEVLPNLVEKMKNIYVLPKLANCIFITSFNVWMSEGAHIIYFLLSLIFLKFDFQLKQMTNGLFEAIKTTSQALANELKELFD